jgi:hypothetical protein
LALIDANCVLVYGDKPLPNANKLIPAYFVTLVLHQQAAARHTCKILVSKICHKAHQHEASVLRFYDFINFLYPINFLIFSKNTHEVNITMVNGFAILFYFIAL